MVAQCVEQRGAGLNLRFSLLAVDVENDFYVSAEIRRLVFGFFGLCFNPQVIGDRGACSGDTDPFQKLTPARIVVITIITRLGHCNSPVVVLLVKPFSGILYVGAHKVAQDPV